MKAFDYLKTYSLASLPIAIGMSVAEIALNFGNINLVGMLSITIVVNICTWTWLWRHHNEEENLLQERAELIAAIEQRKALLIKAFAENPESLNQLHFEQVQEAMRLGWFSTEEVEQIFSSLFDAWESAPRRSTTSSNACRYYNARNPELLKCAVNPTGDCADCRDRSL